MVNSRESSPDWLHDFKAPASAPVNISSSSTSESYGVPSWSAGEVNEGKGSRPRKIDRQDVSSDDEPVSKFKRQSSSQEINEEASGQKRDLLSSEAKVKTQAKKRTRTDAGLESGGDEDDSAKKNGVHGNGDVSWNGQREDGSAAKRKKVEGRGRGRGEGGGGRGRGAGRGRSALGADKKLGGEAKKGGVIAKVDEGKGRGRGTAGPETGVQKQVGLDKWLSTKPAMPAPPLQDTAKGQPLLNVKKESGITHDAVTKNELNDMVCVDGGRLETKAAVKREPLGGIKDAARWMQNDMGDEKPAEKKVTGGGEKKGREEMRTAGIKEVKMELKRGDREFSEAVTDADAMVEEEGDEEDGTKGADAAEDLKKKGKVKVLSRLPLMLPEKISRTKVLVECDSDAAPLDLSGDVGSVGRFSVRDAGEDCAALLLDIKGTVYKGSIMSSTTFFVVNVGATEAKLEAIMNDFMLLQEETNIFDAETMVEGTLDDILDVSDSEWGAAPKDRDSTAAPNSGKAAKGGKQGVKQKDEGDGESEMDKFNGGESEDEFSPTPKKAKGGSGSGGKGAGKGGGGGAKRPKSEKETARRAPAGAGRGRGARAGAGRGSRAKAKPKGAGKPRGKGRGAGAKEGKQRAKETFKGMEEDD